MNKEDFRIRRTKNSIKEAFLNLMKEKPYNKISVKEITRDAVINRNTFYLHYMDKDDLLDKLLNESLLRMKDSMEEKSTEEIADLNYDIFYHIVYNQFKAVEDDIDFFNLVLGDDSIPYLQAKFVLVIKRHMSQGSHLISKERMAYIEFLSAGLTGLIKFWLKNRETYTCEELATIVINIYSKDVLLSLK